ncbi:sodium:solute symporter [Roseimaritima sediminicola]|uniref:sodium:solute symporter n=1 Tax=Roseimaritima sediminicola TaxID=2662066 RepID=UPI00192A1B09|nr:sodium:solute symporter [Roseimaritima sediminicola]
MLQLADLIVLTVYMGAVVAFGCWFVRRNQSSAAFMVAQGALPAWAVGLSIFGTFLSSNTFLGVPGRAYAGNYNAFVFSLSLPVAAYLATRFFVPFYRNTGSVSAYQHLEQRFGVWARMYAVVCYLLTQIARMGTIMVGVSLVLHALTGWDPKTIILVAGILITVYTLLGGMEAVIWTDVVQSIVLMVGAVALLVMLLWDMSGGPAQTIEMAAAENKFSLGSWQPDLTSKTVWVVFLFGVFINLGNFGIDQSFVQRYHTADSDAAAGRAVWLGAILYVPISLLFFFIGTAAYTYYQTHPELLEQVRSAAVATGELDASATIQHPKLADKILPHFIATKLPFGMAGLLIAAIAAAAMSSIDTSLNSSATILLEDIYKRWRGGAAGVGESESMWVLRVATVAVGIIGTVIAVQMVGVHSILDAWWQLQGVFAGGILGLFLLGMLSRSASGGVAAVAVAAGILVIGWISMPADSQWFPDQYRSALEPTLAIVAGTTTIFGVGLLLSAAKRQFS